MSLIHILQFYLLKTVYITV